MLNIFQTLFAHSAVQYIDFNLYNWQSSLTELQIVPLCVCVLSFQRWTRWVARKRTQAAAASSSPSPSRMPASWRASPSCFSSPPTLDRYSWASTGLLWTNTSPDQCEMRTLAGLCWWKLASRRREAKKSFFFSLSTHWKHLSLGSLAAVRQVHTQYQKYLRCAAVQFPHAVDPRQRGDRLLSSVFSLTAASPPSAEAVFSLQRRL